MTLKYAELLPVHKEPRITESPRKSKPPTLEPDDRREVEFALRDSEKRHQDIIESIEEGYTEVDLRGTTVFCNDSFCRITGYPKEELIGLNYREYMSESMAKMVFKAYNEVYNTEVPNKGFIYEIIRKGGNRRIIENSISLVKNSKGHRIGFRSIVRDITARKRTEEELEKHRSRLQAIFGSVKDAIITVNTEMKVVEANKATKRICDLVPKEIIGREFTSCSTQCNKNCHEAIRETLRSKITIREYQIECCHRNQPQQRVIVTSSPLLNRYDEFMGAVVIIRDITRLSNLERELKEKHQFQNMIGKSSEMKDVFRLLNDLADMEVTVLIKGESGTGKSMAGKALHYSGSRALEPFVTVNCSTLSESLIESELFGHVRGAFTGAIKDTVGRFQTAQGGTILLDEIGDISPRIQLKLLRVLEEKEFERVGESVSIKVCARIIACTNRDLKEKVRLGEFRDDLYYRLKVVEVILPPLRKRREDILLLVEHFCMVFNKTFKKKIQGLSDEVISAFMNYHWPGNIRELRHSIEHAFVLCRGSNISLEHIPSEISEYSGIKKSIRVKYTADEPNVIAALDRTDWNKAKAARLLGIDRSTLYRKINKYNLIRPAE